MFSLMSCQIIRVQGIQIKPLFRKYSYICFRADFLTNWIFLYRSRTLVCNCDMNMPCHLVSERVNTIRILMELPPGRNIWQQSWMGVLQQNKIDKSSIIWRNLNQHKAWAVIRATWCAYLCADFESDFHLIICSFVGMTTCSIWHDFTVIIICEDRSVIITITPALMALAWMHSYKAQVDSILDRFVFLSFVHPPLHLWPFCKHHSSWAMIDPQGDGTLYPATSFN